MRGKQVGTSFSTQAAPVTRSDEEELEWALSKTLMGQFDPADLNPEITAEMRSVFIDVIMRWASVDGAVSRLFASFHGLDDITHADDISSYPTTAKLLAIKRQAARSNKPLAAGISKLKKKYERFAPVRNQIAHSHCAGVLRSDPNRAVFLQYASQGSGGLLVNAIHVDEFRETIRFGQHLRDEVERIDRIMRGAALPLTGEIDPDEEGPE